MFFRRDDALVEHLKAEVAWLKQQMIHERSRAERAIDQLLAFRLPGSIPITPTPAEVRDANAVTPEETPERIVERMLNDQEFQSAGKV